jgi:2,3-dihydroxybenzoate decarboxylase
MSTGQSSGPNGDTMLHYDQDNYDVFWKTVQDLDIPVYMHPRLASPTVFKQLWEGRPGWGPQVFSTGVSIHTLGLCGNGVFDRFPKVQFIIGHLGEGIPADIWRLDHCNALCTVFSDFEGLDKGMHKRVKAKKSLLYYFKNNVHVTTSGHYCDETLKLCMNVYVITH